MRIDVLVAVLAIAPSATARVPTVRRCDPSGAQHAEALAALETLDASVRALGDEASVEPVLNALKTLFKSECFALAAIEGEQHWWEPRVGWTPPHPISVRSWWRDGGFDWLRSYLVQEVNARGAHIVVLAPSLRWAARQDATLWSHVACPDGDAGCPDVPEDWRASVGPARSPVTAQMLRDCARRSHQAPRQWRYRVWRECIEETRSACFPIGRLRVPDHGWLVIESARFRTHVPRRPWDNQPCNVVEAFDLGTGAFGHVSTCPAALARSDGLRRSVDARGVTVVDGGRVEVGPLRRWVWQLVGAHLIDPCARERAERAPLPDGLSPVWALPARRSRGGFGRIHGLGKIDTSLITTEPVGVTWRTADRELLHWNYDWLLPVHLAAYRPKPGTVSLAAIPRTRGCPEQPPPFEAQLPSGPERERVTRAFDDACPRDVPP